MPELTRAATHSGSAFGRATHVFPAINTPHGAECVAVARSGWRYAGHDQRFRLRNAFFGDLPRFCSFEGLHSWCCPKANIFRPNVYLHRRDA